MLEGAATPCPDTIPSIEDYARQIVDAAPPLTESQRISIRHVFGGKTDVASPAIENLAA